MKKCINGVMVEMPADEIARQIARQEELAAEAAYQDRIRPRTEAEGIAALCRSLVQSQVASSEDKTLGIACMALVPVWSRKAWVVGDVATDPATGYPYECILAHDSAVNTDWTIAVRTLWKPWHSRSADYALPYEAPTGAHDMYRAGEYMIWTDRQIYKAVLDTSFGPDVRPEEWTLA